MKILTVPGETETLRRKSRPILKFDEELAKFLRELGETLKSQKDPAGVGLSAIQVGNPIRVFETFLPIENTEPKGPTLPRQGRTLEAISKTKPELTFYINPEIVEHAAEMTLGEELIIANRRESEKRMNANERIKERRPFLEGCLSIPRIYGEVLRWPWIKVKYQILSGGEVSDTLQGLTARVFQHELDHLNGILFTDHVLAQGNQLFRETGREMVEMEM